VPGAVTLLLSLGDGCGKLMPFDRPVGSKSITGLSYKAGTCASTGGAPTGSAKPDPDENRSVE